MPDSVRDYARANLQVSESLYLWGERAETQFAWQASPSLLLGISIYRPEWGVEILCNRARTLHTSILFTSPDVDQTLPCGACGVVLYKLAPYWTSDSDDSLTDCLTVCLEDLEPLRASLTASLWAETLTRVAEDANSYPWYDHTLSHHDTTWPEELTRRLRGSGLDSLVIAS